MPTHAVFGIDDFIVAAVLSAVLSYLTRPRPKAGKPGDFTVPTAQEGDPVPVGYGTFQVAPLTVWFGNIVKSKFSTFWRYAADMHMVLCWGRVNELIDISFDGKSARNHHLTTSGGVSVMDQAYVDPEDGAPASFDLNGLQDEADDENPSMFGGRQQSGGPDGFVEFWFGRDTQDDHSYLTFRYGEAHTWPGLCHTLFYWPWDLVTPPPLAFIWTYNTPNPPVPRFLLRRTAWYEAATSPLGQSAAQMTIGNDANPAEICYDLITNTRYGLGVSASLIDTASFTTAAATLRTEVISASKTGFGLSCLVSSSEEASKIIRSMLDHIDAVIATDPTTGLLQMKLLRDDYTVGALLTVNISNARNVELVRSSWPSTLNEVRVTYQRFVNDTQHRTFVESIAQAQDLANRLATGSVRSTTIAMPFCTDESIAALIAQRQLRKMAFPLATVRWQMNREGYGLMPGDVVKLTWAPLGVEDLIVRITEANYGELVDGTIELVGVEDIFSVASASYSIPPSSGWAEPSPYTEVIP